MSTQLSKLCADHLRTNYRLTTGEKLKASHARELVAAFLGYKSHAALLAEKKYSIDDLEEAHIFIPNVPLMELRKNKLTEVPANLPTSFKIAQILCTFLEAEGHTSANIWLYDSLENYCVEVLLVECQDIVDDQLAGVMAETNAGFWEQPWYEIESIDELEDELVIIASAQHEGESLDDKPFCGDTIDFQVQITLPRVSGKRGFYDFDIAAGGQVNHDWVDPELRYDSVKSSNDNQPLAVELGITDSELDQLEWEVQENASNDGLIYDFVVYFSEHNPPELLAKIKGLDSNNSVRVSANAFDGP